MGFRRQELGFMSINIEGAAKRFCALYAKRDCIGFMVILGKRNGPNLRTCGLRFLILFAGNMTELRPIMTEMGHVRADDYR